MKKTILILNILCLCLFNLIKSSEKKNPIRFAQKLKSQLKHKNNNKNLDILNNNEQQNKQKIFCIPPQNTKPLTEFQKILARMDFNDQIDPNPEKR